MARGLFVLLAAALATWLALAITMSSLAGRNRPAWALAWWPWSAVAAASSAEALVDDASPSASDLAEAEALAEQALRREPVNVVAARTLGLVAALQRQDARADSYLNYAEALSRRDLPTQLVLIEREVSRNDIPGALRHYDRALRSTRRSADILMPVLIRASSDPNIARPLARLLASRPPWWLDFTERLIAQGQSASALALVARDLRLDPNHEGERPLLIGAMNRIVALGGVREAYALNRAMRLQGTDTASLLRNGDFESNEAGLPPFDWSMADEPGLAAFREVRDATRQDHALFLVAENGRSGEAARQLLLLRPGRYHLSFAAGEVVGDTMSRPQITLTCTGENGPQLLAIRAPLAPAAGVRMNGDFEVPAAQCTGQWLSVRAGSGIDQQNMPWVDQFAINRR